MKNTDKLITEVPFPALTICSPGLHMNNVEQHLLKGFAIWRLQNKRNGTTKEAIQKDTEEFMQSRFQIEPTESGEQPIGILDILDTMIAPDVEDSVAANGVREHAIACKESESKKMIAAILAQKTTSICLATSALTFDHRQSDCQTTPLGRPSAPG